jgi:hypothetical protein
MRPAHRLYTESLMAREASPGRRARTATLAVILLLLGPFLPRAWPQGAGSATLRGTILDASGGVVPGVSLTLTSVRTRLVRTATSQEDGSYVFAALTPGPYRLTAELTGFVPWESSEVHLSLGGNVQLDATLALAGMSEELTVTARREMVRSDHGAREGLITSDQIQDLSIVGRSAMELVRILPGVLAPDSSSMEVVGFTQGANDFGNYSVNGGRSAAINPVLDGAKILDIGSNTGLMLNMNTDMVEEVKVQTSNYAAEYGTAPYQITALTKGGASSFHGSVYDYWRNWRFSANDRSNNYAGIPRPESDYHYPGFNLSGPVVLPGTDFNKDRDKLFFFVGFELQRQTIDQGTSLTVVPTAAQRRGDFSGLLVGEGQNLAQPQVVTIPNGFPGAGQPAPNNDLSPYIDPLGQAFLNMYPLPNYEDPDNRYNYALNELMPLNRWQLTSRLDWNINETTHAYLRLAFEGEDQKWSRGTWNCCSSVPLPSRVDADNRAWSVAMNVTSILSPSLTNEIVMAASQLKFDNHWENLEKVSKSALGLEGFEGVFPSDSPSAPMTPLTWGQPLAGLEGSTGGMPIFAHNDSVSVMDNLTKVWNAHTIKLGVYVERAQKQQNFQTLEARIILGSPWTSGATGNDYGDLLVGRMAEYQQQTPIPSGEFRFWNYEAYVQDSWKVRRNLTLEAGLRLSKMPSNAELNGLSVRFEPLAYDPGQGPFVDGDPQQPNGMLLASRGEIPDGILDDPGLKLMPRVNFAWDVRGDGDTIVRGGAGLFYRRASGNDQYYVIQAAPNVHNTDVFWWDIPEGLTISSLPTIDPWSRLAASSVTSLDARSNHIPRTWNWSLGVAKRLPWQQTLEVAYVGSRSENQPNRTRADYIEPGTMTGTLGNADLDNPLHRAALDEGVAATLRSFPAYSSVDWIQYEAWADYHALQATLSRSAGAGLQYLLAYTFGRTRGIWGWDYVEIDPIDPEGRSTGVTPQDRRHIFNASWHWMVPDPIRPDGSGLLRGLLNGWQLSGITSYASGFPYRVYFTGALAEPTMQRAWWGTDGHELGGVAWAGHTTPVFEADPRLGNTGVGEKLLDIGLIGIPALGTSGPFQPPFDFRAPTRWNWDLTVMKNFPLGGSRRLQLRVGIFNLFNQAVPEFDLDLWTECNVRVDGVPNGAGGYSYNVCDPSQGFHFTELTRENFGKIITKRGRRIIELAARFEF